MMNERRMMRVGGTSMRQVWCLVEQALQIAELSVNDSFQCRFKTSVDGERAISEHFIPVLETVFLGDQRLCP